MNKILLYLFLDDRLSVFRTPSNFVSMQKSVVRMQNSSWVSALSIVTLQLFPLQVRGLMKPLWKHNESQTPHLVTPPGTFKHPIGPTWEFQKPPLNSNCIYFTLALHGGLLRENNADSKRSPCFYYCLLHFRNRPNVKATLEP